MELMFLIFIFSCLIGYSYVAVYSLLKKRIEKEFLEKGVPFILKDYI